MRPPQDTGLYYDRYLREVIEVLETDPHFREKLQTANTEDIKVSSSSSLHLHPHPLHEAKSSNPTTAAHTLAPNDIIRT